MSPPTTTTLHAPDVTQLRRDVGVVVLAALTLFGATLSANLVIAHDSVGYLRAIVGGPLEEVLHPHHLLYNPAAALWLGALRALGVDAGAPALVSLLNAVFGALSAGLVFALLRRRGAVPRPLAFAGTALVVSSFGFWFYSICVEVYIVPLCFLLAALFVVTAERLTPARLAAVGALHGLAMVFHQVHVLFGVVVLAALWAKRGDLRGRWGLPLALYLGAGTLVVVTSYGAALAALGIASPEEAWLWFTGYAHQEHFWNSPSVSTAAKAAVGFTRAFVGMHFAFALEPVQALMQQAFPNKFLTDEVFLVRGLSASAAYALLSLAAIAGATLLGAFVLGLRRYRLLPSQPASLVRLTTVWLLVYGLFFFFWEPHNVEFWIPQSVCVWLLITLLWRPTPGEAAGRRAAVFAGLAGLLFVVNYWGTIRFAQDPDRDAYRYAVAPLAEVVRDGDLVVLGRTHLMRNYVEYLTDARALGIDKTLEATGSVPAAVDSLRGAIAATLSAGRAVIVPASATTPEPQVRLQYGEDVQAVMDALWRPYRSTWAEQTPVPDVTYYRIAPPVP